ncbi:LysM peptidoglycan-binding domain-containing protein [Bacillus tuaregi]|uniref:LysM peptidoglycan-binding domain-containing protein n=1 Tax=Bacillus tuaregi TaxID=1816695 RepID=UPI0008F7FF2B|nr:LysM peptidoglycan-binding domain-containing protein [Bacillus tuaregi]
MDRIQKYELRRINQSDEYEIVLYLAEDLSEFADELGTLPKDKKTVVSLAKQIVKQHYPNMKVTMVKVIIGGMAVTAIPFMSGNVSTAQASTSVNTTQVAQEDSIYYQVASGDTLWNLSQRFNTTVDLIKRANNLTSDNLNLNQKLMIPKAIHTVGTGDYLTVLAKKYGTTVSAIKVANSLTNDSTQLGQVLIIPTVMSGQTQPAPAPVTQQQPAPPATTQPQPVEQINTYRVVAGDNLFAIANRFGTTVDALRTSNNLTTDLLQIGQTLTIPSKAAIAPPQGNTAPAPQQTNSTYTVVAGDSLSLIAKRFGITVDALKTANQLSTDFLRIGQVLTIPTGTIAPETGTVQVKPPPVETAVPTTYTVVAGDNLWAISQRFGITVPQLKSANQLTTDALQIGQALTIPTGTTGSSQPAPATGTTESAPTPAPETTAENRVTFTYSVRSGDTLYAIAKRYDVPIDKIRSANQLTSDALQVGQALTIPDGMNAPEQTGANTITYTTHTVASGDNIWDLSVRYGIPQAELLRANNLTTSSRLSIGQKLKVPVYHIAVKPVISERHGELLDWWSEAQYIFTIGKTAKVTDYATGKSFNITRTVGANHADSETVSINDTNIAKSIWGGFSWTPRAVILEIDGRRIAASMSFMPHEREYIANNGITGHFDVYFGNSTRHVDGKPDASHQKQVERAAGLK